MSGSLAAVVLVRSGGVGDGGEAWRVLVKPVGCVLAQGLLRHWGAALGAVVVGGWLRCRGRRRRRLQPRRERREESCGGGACRKKCVIVCLCVSVVVG